MGALEKQKAGKSKEAYLSELEEIVTIGALENPSLEQRDRVKRWLADHPEEWRKTGELADDALEYLLKTRSWGAIQSESVPFKIAELREGLGYEQSNPLERLLIDQVVLCWTRLYFLEDTLTRQTTNSHNKEIGIYWERRVTATQQRYNQALISLAKVRKLKLPDITAIKADVAYVNAGGPVEMEARQLKP